MREHTCAFTGYRPQKLPFGYDEEDILCVRIKRALRYAVRDAFSRGFCRFMTGMAEGVDMWGAEAVLSLADELPGISLSAALPCPEQTERWSRKSRRRHEGILLQCAEVIAVSDSYRPGCMEKRNRYMVDNSGALIAVYDGISGGTANTVAYAVRRGIPVVTIDPHTSEIDFPWGIDFPPD